MICPKCGSEECWRDEVDVGVDTVYGPYGCADCGWSEEREYDLTDGPKERDGYALDQWGGLTKLRNGM